MVLTGQIECKWKCHESFFPVPRHTHSSDRPSDANQWMPECILTTSLSTVCTKAIWWPWLAAWARWSSILVSASVWLHGWRPEMSCCLLEMLRDVLWMFEIRQQCLKSKQWKQGYLWKMYPHFIECSHSASWCWGEASHLDPAWQVLYSEMGTVPSCCQCSWGTMCSTPAVECECDHPLSWYVSWNHDAGVSGFCGFPRGRCPR